MACVWWQVKLRETCIVSWCEQAKNPWLLIVWVKKNMPPYIRAWLLRMLTDFHNFFTVGFSKEFAIELLSSFPSHLIYVATLPFGICKCSNYIIYIQQDSLPHTEHVKHSAFWNKRQPRSFHQTCGPQTVQIWIQLTIEFGEKWNNVSTRRNFMTSMNWSSVWSMSGMA